MRLGEPCIMHSITSVPLRSMITTPPHPELLTCGTASDINLQIPSYSQMDTHNFVTPTCLALPVMTTDTSHLSEEQFEALIRDMHAEAGIAYSKDQAPTVCMGTLSTNEQQRRLGYDRSLCTLEHNGRPVVMDTETGEYWGLGDEVLERYQRSMEVYSDTGPPPRPSRAELKAMMDQIRSRLDERNAMRDAGVPRGITPPSVRAQRDEYEAALAEGRIRPDECPARLFQDRGEGVKSQDLGDTADDGHGRGPSE